MVYQGQKTHNMQCDPCFTLLKSIKNLPDTTINNQWAVLMPRRRWFNSVQYKPRVVVSVGLCGMRIPNGK